MSRGPPGVAVPRSTVLPRLPVPSLHPPAFELSQGRSCQSTAADFYPQWGVQKSLILILPKSSSKVKVTECNSVPFFGYGCTLRGEMSLPWPKADLNLKL